MENFRADWGQSGTFADGKSAGEGSIYVKDLPAPHYAALRGDTERLREEIEKDAESANLRDDSGKTPLFYATLSRQIECIELLLSCSANIDAQDSLGRTPLSVAAYQGWVDGVLYLLSEGGNQEISDKNGRLPFHAATYIGDERVMSTLMETMSNADIDRQDNEGMTALHWAAYHSRPHLVQFLIDHGANLCVRDIDGKVPLHWAAQNGSVSCCKLITSASSGSELVKMKDYSGKSPIHLSAAAGHDHVLNHLVQVPFADFEQHDPQGRTPLHWAAATGRTGCVTTLLRLGANKDLEDHQGATPYTYAEHGGHWACCDILNNHDPNNPLKTVSATTAEDLTVEGEISPESSLDIQTQNSFMDKQHHQHTSGTGKGLGSSIQVIKISPVPSRPQSPRRMSRPRTPGGSDTRSVIVLSKLAKHKVTPPPPLVIHQSGETSSSRRNSKINSSSGATSPRLSISNSSPQSPRRLSPNIPPPPSPLAHLMVNGYNPFRGHHDSPTDEKFLSSNGHSSNSDTAYSSDEDYRYPPQRVLTPIPDSPDVIVSSLQDDPIVFTFDPPSFIHDYSSEEEDRYPPQMCLSPDPLDQEAVENSTSALQEQGKTVLGPIKPRTIPNHLRLDVKKAMDQKPTGSDTLAPLRLIKGRQPGVSTPPPTLPGGVNHMTSPPITQAQKGSMTPTKDSTERTDSKAYWKPKNRKTVPLLPSPSESEPIPSKKSDKPNPPSSSVSSDITGQMFPKIHKERMTQGKKENVQAPPAKVKEQGTTKRTRFRRLLSRRQNSIQSESGVGSQENDVDEGYTGCDEELPVVRSTTDLSRSKKRKKILRKVISNPK